MTVDPDKLRELMAGTTPGPWVVYDEPDVGLPPSLFAGRLGHGFDCIEPLQGADLDLVAAMHEALPDLLALQAEAEGAHNMVLETKAALAEAEAIIFSLTAEKGGLQAEADRMRGALEEIARLDPETLYGRPDRDGGRRPAYETLDEAEVKHIARKALEGGAAS